MVRHARSAGPHRHGEVTRRQKTPKRLPKDCDDAHRFLGQPTLRLRRARAAVDEAPGWPPVGSKARMDVTLSPRRRNSSSSQTERLLPFATFLRDTIACLYSLIESLRVHSYSIPAASRMMPSIGQWGGSGYIPAAHKY